MMKLGIIAEFYDRASKGMKKLMRANSRLEKQARAQQRLEKGQSRNANKAARAQDKLARSSQKSGRAFQIQARAARLLKSSLSSAANAAARLMRFQAKMARKGFGQMKAGGGRLMRGGLVAGGLAVGAAGAAGAAANTVIGPAAQMEQNQVILETLEGTAKKAKKAMQWVTNFAVTTPYELNQVMDAFVRLRANGLNPTNGLLRTLGDTSAAMGKDLMQGVEAIADAVTGENERLKEFGIKARKIGKYFHYEYSVDGQTKVKKALASDRAAIQQTLSDIFNSKFAGAMEKLAATWKGMISNMSDMWFKFRLMVADSGVFDFARQKLRGFLDLINKMEASGQLKTIAKEIGDNIIMALKVAWEFGRGVVAVFKVIGQGLSWAADQLGGWNRLAAVLVALPFVSVLAGAALGVFQLAAGLAMIAAGPIGLVVAGVALVAALLIDDWGAALDWVMNAWGKLKALAISVWPSIKAAWGEAKTWFSNLFAAITPDIGWAATFSNAWTSIKSTWAGAKTFFGNIWQNVSSGFSAYVAPIGEKLKAVISTYGSIFEKLGKIGGKLASLWSSSDTESLNSFIKILGKIAGFTFDVVLGSLNILLTGIDTLLGLVTGDTTIDWASFIPDLPEIPDLSSWKQPILDFVSFKWLPAWSWPEFSLPKLPELKLPQLKLPEGAQVAMIKVLAAPINKAYEAVNTIWGKIKGLFNWSPIDTIKQKFGPIAATISGFVSDAATKAGAAWTRLKNVFSNDDPITIAARDPASIERATLAADKLQKSLTSVSAVDVSPAMGKLNKLYAAASGLPGAVGQAISKSKALLAGVDFTHQGKRMMDTLAAGIRARAQVVVAEIQKVTQAVRNHLPSSPAKVGPLSDIHQLKFTETIAASINPAPMVKAMRVAAFATMAAATPLGSGPIKSLRG